MFNSFSIPGFAALKGDRVTCKNSIALSNLSLSVAVLRYIYIKTVSTVEAKPVAIAMLFTVKQDFMTAFEAYLL